MSLLSRRGDGAPRSVAADLNELHGVDFVFPTADDPELMYSFKHALTQDVVYGGLLERRRRQYHAAAGRGLEELYAGHVDEVVELLVYHFGRSGEDEKAVDYAHARRREGAAAVGEHRGARLLRGGAQAAGSDARHRGEPTAPDRRRRQAGGDDVRPRASRRARRRRWRRIRELVDATADPPRRAAWYYWTGFLHSLTGARPEVADRLLPRGLGDRGRRGFDEIRARRMLPGPVYSWRATCARP